MKRTLGKAGFSLLELLTVIAIIAILAAVMFPVMKSVKDRAKKSGCMSNLHSIGVAVQEYKLDNRRCPLALLARYDVGSPMPATMREATGGLFPEYVRSMKGFVCPAASTGNVDAPFPLPSDPGLTVLDPVTGLPKEVRFFTGDSYDWTTVPGAPPTAMSTYAYTWWPDFSTPTAMKPSDPPDTLPKGRRDFARQVRFANPDASTVVTWCMNHGDNALVLFMDGSVDQIPASRMTPEAAGGENVLWRILPKED